jgi:diacylglycerol kinase (ATP)
MPYSAIPLFINPVAGRGRARGHVQAIARIFAEAGIAHEVIESTAVGDIENKVLNAVSSGGGKIVVAGGDGSIHEAVNGIMRSTGKAALGVIPLGSGNDFAKACAIPLDWQVAASALAKRLRDNIDGHRVDVGRMNERYFANSVGLGFGARINEIARGNRLPIGALNYLIAVFQGVWDGVITPSVRMRYGESAYDGTVTLVEVCNGPTVGGMFRMAPNARNSDGLLDLVFVRPVSRPRIFALLPRLLRGTHVTAPEVSCAQATTLHVLASAPLPSHLDGEVQPLRVEFAIEVLPGAIEIL